jgi:hypothetical protein
MDYKLPEEIINKVLAYLGKRPYEEVHLLVAEIRTNAEKLDTINPKASIKKQGKQNGSNKNSSR